MGEYVEVEGADGFRFKAYKARPSGPLKCGLILLQEIFGLDEGMIRDADRWAEMGFEILAPSLFDRLERGFTAGHDPIGVQAGLAHARATSLDQALGDVAACRDTLAWAGGIFVIGYCYGGSWLGSPPRSSKVSQAWRAITAGW